MKKVLLSLALVFAVCATSSVMAQEEKKEACSHKTECTKDGEKKCCKSDKKKCCKSDKKKCTKENAEKKCCKKDANKTDK